MPNTIRCLHHLQWYIKNNSFADQRDMGLLADVIGSYFYGLDHNLPCELCTKRDEYLRDLPRHEGQLRPVERDTPDAIEVEQMLREVKAKLGGEIMRDIETGEAVGCVRHGVYCLTEQEYLTFLEARKEVNNV